LDAAGVPAYKEKLSNLAPAWNLVLTERNPRMIEKDTAVVELVYENGWDTDAVENDIDQPNFGILSGEVRCNVQQKGSNTDLYGNQVVVSHTYPAGDPNYPSETKSQTGEFQYYDAQRSFMVTGIKRTPTPWLIANTIVGRVNSVPFSGEAPRMWLCTACNWKGEGPHGGTNEHRYFMQFEFAFDPDTWDPTVIFIDDVTGKPPLNVVPGTGLIFVEKLPACDFEDVIGAIIQGG
jgi:hypothetical protein